LKFYSIFFGTRSYTYENAQMQWNCTPIEAALGIFVFVNTNIFWRTLGLCWQSLHYSIVIFKQSLYLRGDSYAGSLDLFIAYIRMVLWLNHRVGNPYRRTRRRRRRHMNTERQLIGEWTEIRAAGEGEGSAILSGNILALYLKIYMYYDICITILFVYCIQCIKIFCEDS